jgi:hypothetical protein
MRTISCAVFARRSILVSRLKRIHEPFFLNSCAPDTNINL